MKTRRMTIWMMLLGVVALSMGLLALDGCKKSDESSTKTAREMQSHEGHEHAAMEAEPAADTVSSIEQKTCPVMGGAINEDIFVEYKGKKVYFCCAGCEERFLANPEQYLAELPQFKQQERL
jgi:YHS domain-containing protein